MKDAVIAKLANQAADFYGDAFKQCQYKDNLPKVCEGHSDIHANLKTARVSHKAARNTLTASHVSSALKDAYRVWILYDLMCA